MNPWFVSAVGAIAVVFAALMAWQRSLYAAAVCLMVVLLQTAALFMLAGSPLLAFLQIMIYAGAIMVMIVVTIMASPAAAARRTADLQLGRPLAGLAVALLAGEVAWLVARAAPSGGVPTGGAAAQAALGAVLFGPYAAATEAVTLLMLLSSLALVGRLKNEGVR